jgi:FdhE protein
LPTATTRLIDEIKRRAGREGASPPLFQFYLQLLEVSAETEALFTPPEARLNEETVRARMRQGIPLLKPSAFKPDHKLLPRTGGKVIRLFADYADLFDLSPEAITTLSPRTLLSAKAVKTWLETGNPPPPEQIGDLNPALVENIIRASLRPFLLRYAEKLLGMIPQELWRRAYCPVCGGDPDISFLEHEQGGRWLVCSRCDSEWQFQRLECAFCGTKDQASLGHYTSEDGLYRLYTCESCKQYLKTVDLRQTDRPVFLPLERLDTLDIDRQAEEMGYAPGIRHNDASG